MVYKYWPQHLLSALPARGTGLCYCTPRHGWDEVLSCSDKAMDWLPSLQHCLPGNTILLPALQMLWAFPGGPTQAQKGNYEARPKRKKKNTAFRKQVEKRGREKREEAFLFQLNSLVFLPPHCIPTYHFSVDYRL